MAVVGGWGGAVSLPEEELEPFRCGRTVYTRTTSGSKAGMMTTFSKVPLGEVRGGSSRETYGVLLQQPVRQPFEQGVQMTDSEETERDAVVEVIEQDEPIGDHQQGDQETPGPGALAAPHGIRQRGDPHAKCQQVTGLPQHRSPEPKEPLARSTSHDARLVGGDVRHKGDDAEDGEQCEGGEEPERAIGGATPRKGG